MCRYLTGFAKVYDSEEEMLEALAADSDSFKAGGPVHADSP